MLRARKMILISLVGSLAVTLLVILTLGAPQSEPDAIRIGLIDHDRSAVTEDLYSYFANNLGIEFVGGDSEAIEKQLVEKKISGIAEITGGFQDSLLAAAGATSSTHAKPAPIELTFLDDYTNAAFIRGYFDEYVSSVSVLAAASVVADAAGTDAQAGAREARFEKLLEGTDSYGIEVTAQAADAEQSRREDQKEGYYFILGFFMMFCFMMSITVSQMLHQDRLDGTFRRIRATSATSVEYVTSVALIGFIIALVIEGPAMLIWNLAGAYTGVPVGVTVLMLLIFTLLVTAIGIFVGISMPSFNGLIAVVTALATITSMLGGAWFPIEMAPPLFQTLTKFTPQYWFYEGIYSYENGSGALGLPLAILLLASLLFLILAGIRFASNRGDVRAIAR
jgi:ABC-2 type transport system permease protein